MIWLPLLIAISISTPNLFGQESKTTTWIGTLDARGQELRLEVDIVETGKELTGELRSLDQGNTTLKLSEINQDGKSLGFKIPQLAAEFSGKVLKQGTVAKGTFTQSGFELPLTLKQGKFDSKQPAKNSNEKLKEAWIGELNMGLMKPIMQFRIVTKESGETGAYFDSVTEGRTGFKATWSIDGDKIKFDVAKIKLKYRGTLNETGDTAEGTWSQGGRDVPYAREPARR